MVVIVIIYSYSCPFFLPLPSFVQHISHSHSPSPPYCSCPWVIHTCSLTNPYPFFPPFPSLTAVSLFLVSMSLVLFCLCIYFVHYIPLLSEIIWNLFFIDWLISISIIVPSSIHAVAKGRNSSCCIVFHCVSAPKFFNPFIY